MTSPSCNRRHFGVEALILESVSSCSLALNFGAAAGTRISSLHFQDFGKSLELEPNSGPGGIHATSGEFLGFGNP